MFSKALIVLGLVGVALAGTPFDSCDGKAAPDEVRVKGCKKLPCPVYRGSVGEMDVDFKSSVAAKQVTLKIFATVFGLTVEYVLDDDTKNACNHLTKGDCPLAPGAAVTHKVVFPVSTSYPPIPVSLEIVEENENGEALSCFRLDVVVK